MAKFVNEYARKNGLKKEEAKHDLVISVRPRDVKSGKQKNPETCAIAMAILAQRPEAARAFIFRTTAFVETARRLVRYRLPQAVQREVEAFDRFGVMEPGVYRLKAPATGDTRAYHKKYDKKNPRAARAKNAPERKQKMRLADQYRTGVREPSP